MLSNKSRPTITHVIFDLDGLLLDTEPLIFEVAQAIASRYGKTVTRSARAQTAGRNARDSAQILIELLELPLTVEAYLEQKHVLNEQMYPSAKPMPGAVSLTQHLHRWKIPQAVATSSAQGPFRLKTTHHRQWFELFDCIVTGDDPDIKQGKPAPGIFLVVAQRMGVQPQNCLVFEDSLAGLAAGKAAGMSVVAVPDPAIDPVLYAGADQIIPSLTDFMPSSWGLPDVT